MINNIENLEIEATSVFDRAYTAISKKKIKILVMRGGTRSSKTYSITQLLVLWLVTGKLWDIELNKWVCAVVRKNKTTIKTTVLRDFLEVIEERGYTKLVHLNRSDKILTYQWRKIEFIGADDPQKLKGRKQNILYCNEANELNYKDEFFQLLIRTKDKVIIDFNPDDEDIWINRELEEKRMHKKKDVELIVSTYLDNPFLSDEQVQEIENIKEVDPVLWTVYGEGWYGKRLGRIYNNWDIIDDVPKDAEYITHGLDFGFATHECALYGLYRWNWCLVVDEEFYATGYTNTQMDKEWRSNGVQTRAKEIYADSAEPKSIKELRDLGWNIKPVDKWPDSVEYWIRLLQGIKILITSRSAWVIKEAKKYIWKTDTNGNPTNETIKEFDHARDAIRYGAMMKLWIKRSKFRIASV